LGLKIRTHRFSSHFPGKPGLSGCFREIRGFGGKFYGLDARPDTSQPAEIHTGHALQLLVGKGVTVLWVGCLTPVPHFR